MLSTSPVSITENPVTVRIHSSNPNSISVSKNKNSTTISIHLAASGFMTLNIYDMLCKEIKRLFYGYKKEGNYKFEFPIDNHYSKTMIVQLKTSGYYSSQKITLN